MTFPRGKRIVAAAAILGIALSMGACSGGTKAGTAVESLGVRYTESDVSVAVDELQKLIGQELSRTDVVGMLAETQPAIAIAESQGLEVTDEVRASAVAQYTVNSTSGIEAADLSSASQDILVYAGISQTLSQMASADPTIGQQITELLNPPNTVVNPRYLVVTAEGLQLAAPLADVVREATSSAVSGE